MRLKLLLRRLTVSAPRMAVRSALPWPVRWVVLALATGFCAAIALWAFELGKDLAGLDQGVKTQLAKVQTELTDLKQQLVTVTLERDKAQVIANTADTLMTAEKVAQARLQESNQQLQEEVQRLRGDLGFFELLVPSPAKGAGAVSIRGLQIKQLDGLSLEWQVLVVQADKDPSTFKGQLDLVFSGILDKQPWSQADPGNSRVLSLKKYARFSGVYTVPPRVKVTSITAKVRDGQKVLSVQTARL